MADRAVRLVRAAVAGALCASLLTGPAAADTTGATQRPDLPTVIAGIAESGIPARPAALRPRTAPAAGPAPASPVAVDDGSPSVDDSTAPRTPSGLTALPADAPIAEVTGIDTGEVVVIPAPQPEAAAQSSGLVGIVQLGPDAVTMDEVARHAFNAGFTGEDLVRAVAVAYAESTNNPSATNSNTDGSVDYGLWQINSVHRPPVPLILDPAINAVWAYSIYAQRDRTWFPWYAFFNPFTGERKSDEFMPAARAAVTRMLGAGAVPAPPAPTGPTGPPATVEQPSPTALALAGEECLASWMGDDLAGAPTASGDPFDPDGLTAAMYTVPLGTLMLITNADTGESVEVVINDRGPNRSSGRCIDLSEAAFSLIAGPEDGTINVTVAPA